MSDLTVAARALARDYAGNSMSPATARAYRSDWAHFAAWAAAMGVPSLPADPLHVADYLASLGRTHAPTTIQRRLVSISQWHKLAGHDWPREHPAIAQTLKGMLRSHGRAPKRATAIDLETIRALVETCDASAFGLRDRAMLLVCWAGALRRSELVALRIEDLTFSAAGVELAIRSSKTDQTRQGAVVGIPHGGNAETCPVRAVQAWLAVQPQQHGALFGRLSLAGRLIGYRGLTPGAVAHVLAKRCAAAGVLVHLSPHGLRAGMITAAYVAGASDARIMQHSRHRDLKTMRGYVREARRLMDSPAGIIGL